VPDPAQQRPGRPHLARDGQQWIFDYVIQQSGLTYHWWSDERSLPAEVRSHAMISKHLGRRALLKEAEAEQLAAEGDREAALIAFYAAARGFLKAQHAVFEVNAEKQFLYAGLVRCYEKVRRLSAHRIERIEVEWEDTVVAGWLHLCPRPGRAPLLFNVPGCDTTSEGSPDPADVREHRRGWHVFSFDGPGLGQSNMRGVALTADNFERAAAAALDVLLRRPDIDGERVMVYGAGAGSVWGTRIAAHDQRIRAVATKSGYASLYYLMNEDSPRYKQLFAFLTKARTESELDRILAAMSLEGILDRTHCPMLMIAGEYDLRDPAEEVLRLFDAVRSPAELWMFADQFHRPTFAGGRGVYEAVLDWLEARLTGTPLPVTNRVRYIEPEADGPAGPHVTFKRRWFEQGEPTALPSRQHRGSQRAQRSETISARPPGVDPIRGHPNPSSRPGFTDSMAVFSASVRLGRPVTQARGS
jgi:pimeloyl-ACP methyl ester carboxylesterase